MVHTYSSGYKRVETGGLLDARNSKTEKHKWILFKKEKETNETSSIDAVGAQAVRKC